MAKVEQEEEFALNFSCFLKIKPLKLMAINKTWEPEIRWTMDLVKFSSAVRH